MCINKHYIRIQLYRYVLCTHNNYNDYNDYNDYTCKYTLYTCTLCTLCIRHNVYVHVHYV